MNEDQIMKKQQLGQFFTKNADYIFAGLSRYVINKDIVDPFAGSGDLLDWARKPKAQRVIGYDVDKTYVDNKKIFYNDSLRTPKSYNFVVTNPPYLNVNKAGRPLKEKYFNGSGFEDLYHLSLRSIMDSKEGIVIVPINFLSSEHASKIRNLFFSKFEVSQMNYFKEQVFPDTTYNVIAFYYKKKKNPLSNRFTIETRIYPENKKIKIGLKKEFNWTIGGELLSKIKNYDNALGVYRLIENDIKPGTFNINAAYNHIKIKKSFAVAREELNRLNSSIIFLKAIDSGSEDGRICLDDVRNYGVSCLIGKESSRHMIQLLFDQSLSLKDQEKIIKLFNSEFSKLRDSYLSLFLTNYRDKDRKRISFDFVYKFINYLYDAYINNDNNIGKSGLLFKQYERMG